MPFTMQNPVAGAKHKITGVARKRDSAGVLTPINLTGTTITLHLDVDGGTAITVTGSATDAENGVYEVPIAGEITAGRIAAFQLWVEAPGSTALKSRIVKRGIVRSIE